MSKHWIEPIVDQIESARPDGEIVVASGHSPSGNYHIGLLRELILVNAIVHVLGERGRQARHLDFVDDFDALRKVPVNIDPSYDRYLGVPLSVVPAPEGNFTSYADFFLNRLHPVIEKIGIKPKVIRASEAYPAGKFTEAIEQSLEKLAQAKEILERVSNRRLADDWVPVQILSDNDSLREWEFTGWSKSKQTVSYRSESGEEGEVSYTTGRVKLDWRLDWPARWAIWGVGVEPFGKDHAAAGGSYDTGRELVEQIFGSTAPVPVRYDFVNIIGQTKKMSKSAGNVITPADALDILPAETLRYMMLRNRPQRTVSVDFGAGIYNLIDEYSKVEQAVASGQEVDFAESYRLASLGVSDRTVSSVRFNHLVTLYQAAMGDSDKVFDMLRRTGYEKTLETETEVIKRELTYIANWLEKYAPEDVKFSLQSKLPQVELSQSQEGFLRDLAGAVAANQDPESIHKSIHDLKDQHQLAAGEAFKAVYQVLLGQDSGPKAGFFLSALDLDFLTKRLQLEG